MFVFRGPSQDSKSPSWFSGRNTKKQKTKKANYSYIPLYEQLVIFEVLGVPYHIYFKLFFSWDGGKQLLTFSHATD